MQTTETCYSIEVGKPGRRRLARAGLMKPGAALYCFRSDAVAAKRDLVAYGIANPRVLKVHVTYTWSP